VINRFGLSVLAGILLFPVTGHADNPSTTTPNGKVRVEVLSLKRMEGNTVQLRWLLTNSDNRGFSMTTANARLVDLVGRREYAPGLQSQCRAEPDEQQTCWAVFGAPSTITKTISVRFYEQFDLLTGVPISE
jgi:hypothetical protein